MLYIFDEIEKLDEIFLRDSIPHLSRERRNKVFSYRFIHDQQLSAAAYLLLRFALRETRGVGETVEFSFGGNGKPYLRDYPQIHFNLSHCRRAVACVLSDSEAGVDVQEIEPVSDGLAKRVLTVNEYAAFKASDAPYELFCEYWTIKESSLKRTGQGITADLTRLSASQISETAVFKRNGYLCCTAGFPSRPEHADVSKEQLASFVGTSKLL